MNDKPILNLAVPTTAETQYGFSKVLIPLFQQTMQPEKEVKTLKMLLTLAPELRKLLPEEHWDKQALITHFKQPPVPVK